uniref:F-box protein At4g00755 n=1 Tax=Anthurium amnicola TaxID=1678845 RepID=A0A1D1YTQ8_9ARAE
MGNRYDFLEWLGPDTSSTVLMCLDDPADIVRVSSTSRAWRQFVIANGLLKKLCIRTCPEVSNFTRIVEASDSSNLVEPGSSNSVEWKSLHSENKAYTSLACHLISPISKREIMLESISASSTDNYPDESIENTLEPSDRVDRRPSYWSSGGSRDPGSPEFLIYRLRSKLCVVHEIKVQPFQAFFQPGNPIYSAKAVRFRMGHSKQETSFAHSLVADTNIQPRIVEAQQAASSDYVWTYISPVFPMAQENALQSFKLPRPALCIGGILQIELLGRVQLQEMDHLFYICVCHVKVVGHSLYPKFDVDVLDTLGTSVLKYFPGATNSAEGVAPEDEMRGASGWHAFAERIRQVRAGAAWNQVLLNALLGNVPVEDVDDSGDELFE